MDKLLSFTLSDIKQLEGDNAINSNNSIIIKTHQKKEYSLNFSNLYEKYIFKTVIYNHLVIFFLISDPQNA